MPLVATDLNSPSVGVPASPVPVQPDHFYSSEGITSAAQILSHGKDWLDPGDDPLAQRGIPVFTPSVDEFADFEDYMNKVECWGSKSGIIKVIPPKEWSMSLPSVKDQLRHIKIRSPIEQHMLGRSGLFRQENMEKRKIMSVREWAELCSKDEYRAPSVHDLDLRSGSHRPSENKKRAVNGRKPMASSPLSTNDPNRVSSDILIQSPHTVTLPASASAQSVTNPLAKPKRPNLSKEARETRDAERSREDASYMDKFDPDQSWLPPDTDSSDYTPEFCQKLERQYWRNCGLGKPAWYGADTMGSLYTDDVKSWNVAKLPSTLSRLLGSSNAALPGVSTPYLYFGMWRATFAIHVEDMDLFSINYIHFGAPKFWYAVPQNRAAAMETTMRGYFPADTSSCPQFLRHKSFLASPSLLAQTSCRPNHLVQKAGEFVITYPRGYHAGFNLGFNCAESVNFALESWLELGKKAKVCQCVDYSVRIDVDELLREQNALSGELCKAPDHMSQASEIEKETSGSTPKKRKSSHSSQSEKSRSKKPRISDPDLSGAKSPGSHSPYRCCLCVDRNEDGLLRVLYPPRNMPGGLAGKGRTLMAHRECADVIPETWVDRLEGTDGIPGEEVIFGVDGIVRDRWNLKCSACHEKRDREHGAPIQCTKGKCSKAFHVSCARNGSQHGIVFDNIQFVEKEVILLRSDTSAGANVDVKSSDNDLHESNMTNLVSDPVAPEPAVLKVINKTDVLLLCSQHNPAIAALKRMGKQDKIRDWLRVLPIHSRIKIRASGGVFQVTLLKVNEATSSVEVLWDEQTPREFKWTCVISGSDELPAPLIIRPLVPGSENTASRRRPIESDQLGSNPVPTSDEAAIGDSKKAVERHLLPNISVDSNSLRHEDRPHQYCDGGRMASQNNDRLSCETNTSTPIAQH